MSKNHCDAVMQVTINNILLDPHQDGIPWDTDSNWLSYTRSG